MQKCSGIGWIQTLNCWEWIQGRSLSVRCNHVEELSKHIPTLFPKDIYYKLNSELN